MDSLVWAMSVMTPSEMIRRMKYWEPSLTDCAYLEWGERKRESRGEEKERGWWEEKREESRMRCTGQSINQPIKCIYETYFVLAIDLSFIHLICSQACNSSHLFGWCWGPYLDYNPGGCSPRFNNVTIDLLPSLGLLGQCNRHAHTARSLSDKLIQPQVLGELLFRLTLEPLICVKMISLSVFWSHRR